jgi:nucleoside 2-deoxyribosyltransferase
MIEVNPPSDLSIIHFPTVFLAGSIEMGVAKEWQREAIAALESLPGFVLNPRRKEWDSSWSQRMEFAPFREQVTWELEGLERADWVLFYFDPATKSPVTLLELGLVARLGKAIVCCPEGFWRKGNVDIVCQQFGVPQQHTLGNAIQLIGERIAAGAEIAPESRR